MESMDWRLRISCFDEERIYEISADSFVQGDPCTDHIDHSWQRTVRWYCNICCRNVSCTFDMIIEAQAKSYKDIDRFKLVKKK